MKKRPAIIISKMGIVELIHDFRNMTSKVAAYGLLQAKEGCK
ncbi:hypothetical protein [Virgibacillus sp. CBA3643]